MSTYAAFFAVVLAVLDGADLAGRIGASSSMLSSSSPSLSLAFDFAGAFLTGADFDADGFLVVVPAAFGALPKKSVRAAFFLAGCASSSLSSISISSLQGMLE
jgi:hypothetical protein